MSKLIVQLPSSWSVKFVMDSKDFAMICDIMERAKPCTEHYVGDAKVLVEANSGGVSATSTNGIIITNAEFEEMENAQP